MNFHRLRFFFRLFLVVAGIAFQSRDGLAQGAPGNPADQASQQALELFNDGKNAEAVAAYEGILKNFPTSTVVSEAQFRLGYLYFLLGEHDKSIEKLNKILGPPASPDIQELAYNLLPQVMSAKAAKLKPGDPNRVKAFQDAIKQFDVFIQKFPNSEQVQNANYGRALAFYQIEEYDKAVEALRVNLAKFAGSETILDSQYMLALTLGTQGNAAVRESKKEQAFPKFDEAIKLLGDIVQKGSDVALANDAQLQIGEVLFNRAPFEQEAARQEMMNRAMSAYSAVQPKEAMIKAQTARAAGVLDRIRAASAARDMAALKRLQRVQQREQEKREIIKNKPDQTVLARLRIGAIYFLRNRFDEARTMFRYLTPFAEDDEIQKQLLYYTTLTYASQGIANKAVENYDAFQQKYKGEPLGENLPVVVGAMFLGPKAHDPAKALSYFKEAQANYPKSQLASVILPQQASALVELKQFDEATNLFKKVLGSSPPKELAAAAEFGMATINQQTNKFDEAIKGFRAVRDKYAGTPQAEQAAFFAAQLLVQKGDAKSAIPEFNAFISKYPQSAMMPNALFFLAQAQQTAGDKATALATYEKLSKEFPKSEAAPFAFLQRANIYSSEQKMDEMLKTMREFVAAYPDHPNVFSAYDSIAQVDAAAQKPLEAIAAYREFVEKLPQNPKAPDALVKIAGLWLGYAQTQGRFLALNEQQRVEWRKGVDGTAEAVEQLLSKYPESDHVAQGLQHLLEAQRLLVGAKVKTEADVEKYFQDLADKLAANPGTKNKVLFTLASFTYERDKTKALAQMSAAYDPSLKYAPADLDLYGGALIEQGKLDDSEKVYAKLAADYPNPPGSASNQAPVRVQEAQAIALFGTAKVLQLQGKKTEAAAKFDELKKNYPSSPKILEANYGIAVAAFDQKKYDDVITLLGGIIRAQTATAELRANAFLLNARSFEAKGDIESAINNYLKIPVFFPAVSAASAEGLWRGGQLLEAQAATLPETTAEKNKPTKPGQMAKAVKAYQDLRDKYPTSQFAPKAIERLGAIAPGK